MFFSFFSKKQETDADDDDQPLRRRKPGDDDEPEQPVKLTLRQRIEIIGQHVERAKEWANKNQTKTLLILVGLLFLFLIIFGFIVWHIVSVYHRPTVEDAIEAFDFGAYQESQFRATSVLRYAKEGEYEKRAVASYILGISLLEQFEPSNLPDKEAYFLAAAIHLKEAYTLGLPTAHRTRALLAYGKALYLSDSIEQAIEILLEAEGRPQQDDKTANWFLTHAIMQSEEPDYNLALLHCDKFLADAKLTQMEAYRGMLLRAHILVKLRRLDEANRVFDQVPPLPELEAYQEFVCAQLLMEEGRRLRTETIAQERRLFLPDSSFEIRSTVPPPTALPGWEEEGNAGPEPERLDDAPMLTPSTQLKSAPLPPSITSFPPQIEQAVVRRSQSKGRIVQVRRQVPAAAISNDSVTQSQSLSLQSTGDAAEAVEDLRRRAIAKYREAILRLEMSKAADAADFNFTRQSYLLQGICFEEMEEFENAKEQYRMLIQTFPESDEAIAADILRAELFRKSGRFDLALTGHQRAVLKLMRRGVYQNPILTRREIITKINATVGELMRLREYQDAFDLLAVYEPILPPREIARVKAVGYEGWARMIQRNANAAPFAEQETLLQAAREKFRLAGRQYAVYAQHEITSQDYKELLWRSAENYRYGKDYLKAIPAYREYLKNEIMLRQAETLAWLGQMYFDLDLLDESISVYEEYLKQYPDHPMLYQVRLIKSYAHKEKNELEQAQTLLLENLSGVLAPKAPEYRESIYALGMMYFDAGDREKAISTLEDAVLLHPDAPQAASAYYRIAQAFLKRIDDEQVLMQKSNLTTDREKATLEMQKARQAAHRNFQETRQLLDERELVIPLRPSEQTMQMVCYFEIAKLELLLGRLEDSLDSFNLAQNRFQDRPETLDALIQAAMIYRQLGRNEEARETVQKGKILLQKLTDNKAFPPGYRFNDAEWNELLNFEL